MAKMNLNIQNFAGELDVSYDPEQVRGLIDGIASPSANLVGAIDDTSRAINDLTQRWASDQAKAFGDTFMPLYKSLVIEVRNYIDSVGRFLMTAGEALNEAAHGTESYSWTDVDITPPTAEFQMEIGGRKGADSTAAQEFNNIVNTYLGTIKDNLSAIESQITSSTAFTEEVMSASSDSIREANVKSRNLMEALTEAVVENATKNINEFVAANQSVYVAAQGN